MVRYLKAMFPHSHDENVKEREKFEKGWSYIISSSYLANLNTLSDATDSARFSTPVVLALENISNATNSTPRPNFK